MTTFVTVMKSASIFQKFQKSPRIWRRLWCKFGNSSKLKLDISWKCPPLPINEPKCHCEGCVWLYAITKHIHIKYIVRRYYWNLTTCHPYKMIHRKLNSIFHIIARDRNRVLHFQKRWDINFEYYIFIFHWFEPCIRKIHLTRNVIEIFFRQIHYRAKFVVSSIKTSTTIFSDWINISLS